MLAALHVDLHNRPVVSKYLDDIYDIRVKPRSGPNGKKARRTAPPKKRVCEWKGCSELGEHKAPKSPDQLREWRWFCAEHVRDYNKSWNYFEGMGEDEIRDHMDHANMWDRPTWKVGTNPDGNKTAKPGFEPGKDRPGGFNPAGGRGDPYDLFDDGPGAEQASRSWKAGSHLPQRTRTALANLNLDESASLQDIKTRYKELLIRFHPDTNGGDRSTEERLTQVIDAFNHLRAVKFGVGK